MIALLWGLRQAQVSGFGSAATVLPLDTAGVLLAGWVMWERRVKSPGVDLRVLGARTLWPIYAASFLAGMVIFGTTTNDALLHTMFALPVAPEDLEMFRAAMEEFHPLDFRALATAGASVPGTWRTSSPRPTAAPANGDLPEPDQPEPDEGTDTDLA